MLSVLPATVDVSGTIQVTGFNRRLTELKSCAFKTAWAEARGPPPGPIVLSIYFFFVL